MTRFDQLRPGFEFPSEGSRMIDDSSGFLLSDRKAFSREQTVFDGTSHALSTYTRMKSFTQIYVTKLTRTGRRVSEALPKTTRFARAHVPTIRSSEDAKDGFLHGKSNLIAKRVLLSITTEQSTFDTEISPFTHD